MVEKQAVKKGIHTKEQPKEPKPETKKEPVQPSFDEMNGMTDEEMAALDAAFDSVPENPNDIF